MMEWLRFAVTAVLLVMALGAFAMAVCGVYEFGFVMNRMHAAGIGDTLAMFLMILALIIASGLNMDSLKLFLIIAFMWFTSPVSTHFLGQVEYFTNPRLYHFVDRLPYRLRREKEQRKQDEPETGSVTGEEEEA